MALSVAPSTRIYIRERLSRWLTPTLVSAAVTLWIAMSEIDRLIAGLLDEDGRNGRMVPSMTGVGADPKTTYAIWSGLMQPELDQSKWLVVLVWLYLGLDVVFALVYGRLLWRMAAQAGKFRFLVLIVVVADFVEGGIIALDISGVAAGKVPDNVGLLVAATWTKWGSLLVFAVVCLLLPGQRSAIAGRLVRLGRVIWFHRLTAAAVGIVAVLALLPIPGIYDQMPDSQRMWAESSAGVGYFLINSVIVLLVAIGLFVVGRLRSSFAWQIWVRRRPPSAPPSWILWGIGPILLITAWVVLAAIDWAAAARTGWQFWLFVGLPVALVLASMLVPNVQPLTRRPLDLQRAVDMWRGGDVLAVSLISVTGMALVRSFVGPVAMMMILPGDPALREMPAEWWVLAPGFLLFGLMLGVGIFGFVAMLIRRIPKSSAFENLSREWRRRLAGLLLTDLRSKPGAFTRVLRLVFLALAIISILLMLFFPTWFTGGLGVSATAVLGIGSWAILLGMMIVWAQDRKPLEIFHVIGYRANPFLTLVTVALVVGQIAGGHTSMHLPRQTSAQQLAERHDLKTEFSNWLIDSRSCDIPVRETGKKVRPMLLLAAEGGGIRAADWTARVVEALAGSQCGKQAVLLSSGVSGGSLGLVLATRYAPRTGTATTTPTQAAASIASQEGLAVSVGGTIVTDSIGGATGLLLPNWSNGDFGWHDRAALMERAWEESQESAERRLGGRFTPTDRGAAGALMLNSTVTGSGCRLVFSQFTLPASGPFTKLPPGCFSRTGTPVSIDFFDSDEKGPVFCNTAVSWTTAAALSARFPVISPAGRLEYQEDQATEGEAPAASCAQRRAYQAIDGGYAEGSGLGTLTDTWGELREIVVDHNSSVDAGRAPVAGAEQSYVVPIFVYVRNSPGSDLAAEVPEPISEIVVPLASLKAGQAQSEAEAWLQRLELSADACPQTLDAITTPEETEKSENSEPPGTTCMDATKTITDILQPGRTVVAAPNSRPSVDPPLGWTLSQLSRELLSAALEQEKSTCSHEASLCTLIKVLDHPRN